MSKNDSSTTRTLTAVYLADLLLAIACAVAAERLAAWLVGIG